MKYLRYFFYIAWNWNLRIALHLLGSEIRGEKKYHIQTTAIDELHSLEENGIDIDHATIYMPVSYPLLEAALEQSTPGKDSHFLDIGCGMGRALCVAAHRGFMKVSGIDLSRELCEAAKNNLAITKNEIPSLQYSVINNDAFYFEIPADADCLFLFNPFDEIIMSGVLANIMHSLSLHKRKMQVIYVNPLHKELFLAAGFVETWYTKKLHYLEASILSTPA